jgi:ribosomal RNA assembly protein
MPTNPIPSNPADIFSQVRYDIRIPKSRVAVLIGKNGETKKHIEEETKTKLAIDSQEGDVVIEGTDVVTSFIVRDIVKAIGRGFNPDIALFLLKHDYAFELIELSDFVKNKNGMDRVKGRVIGREGKTREFLEKTAQVNISVMGKTVAILGPVEWVMVAKQAVEMLLDGSPHTNVYKWLESKRRSITKSELAGEKIEIKDEFKKYV